MAIVRRWQIEPWPHAKLADQTLTYRLSIVSQIAALTAFFIWFATNYFDGAIHLPALVVAVPLFVWIGIYDLRLNEHELRDVGAVVLIALVTSGHVYEAIIAASLNTVVMAIRKPIVFHLVVSNLTLGAGLLAADAMIFNALTGDSNVMSARWLIAFAVLIVLDLIANTALLIIPTVVAGYARMREYFGGFLEEIRTVLISVLPAGIVLSAVLIAYPRAITPIVLIGPLLAEIDLHFRATMLLDATKASETDPLTGLLNRRTLMDVIGDVISTATPQGASQHWLIMCDLDNFKQLNDTRGHGAGDIALIAVARELRLAVRRSDTCARFGGEEFVVIIRDTDEAEIGAIAERIRSQIEINPDVYESTVSIGIHRMRDDQRPIDALDSADQAMYAAKRAGKNRVVFASNLQVDNGLQEDAA